MQTAVILSGGVAHAFADTSSSFADLLASLGITSEVSTDLERGMTEGAVDLMIFNIFRDQHFSARYPSDVDDPDWSPGVTARTAVLEHLAGGGGLLAVHGAVISFADWPDWARILGAAWVTGRSGHPKRSALPVRVVPGRHPVVAGLPSYVLADDEAYGFLEPTDDDVVPLAFSEHGGVDHPMLWLREYGGGRIAYLAPCHGLSSLEHPVHREIVRRVILWLLGRVDELTGTERH